MSAKVRCREQRASVSQLPVEGAQPIRAVLPPGMMYFVDEPAFYSDRVQGARSRTLEEITPSVWATLAALIERRINDNWLAEEFPDQCPDGNGVFGTNIHDFRDTLHGILPNLEYPLNRRETPELFDALDLIEFIGRHISLPKKRKSGWHPYFKHHELDFDRDDGKCRFREDVNLIFERNGVAFMLDESVRVRRLGSPESRKVVAELIPDSGDPTLDHLIVDALESFPIHAPWGSPSRIGEVVGRIRAP